GSGGLLHAGMARQRSAISRRPRRAMRFRRERMVGTPRDNEVIPDLIVSAALSIGKRQRSSLGSFAGPPAKPPSELRRCVSEGLRLRNGDCEPVRDLGELLPRPVVERDAIAAPASGLAALRVAGQQ